MINEISFPKLNLYFTVNRAAISVNGFCIYWYGIIIALGLVLAILYGIHESKKINLKSDDFFNMLILCIPSAIICARLYYVIFSFDSYKNNLMDIFAIRNGGLAIYGGVIGAAAVIIIYCKRHKISIPKILDMLSVGLLIGQAIGRWGNFVNGEAFGSFTNLPWAMTVKCDGILIAEMVHPTFLYESLWNALGIAVLLIYKRHKKFDGELFCGYMIWYGIGRALIEGLRTDSLYIGTFRVSQLLSIALAVIGLMIIIIKKTKKTDS